MLNEPKTGERGKTFIIRTIINNNIVTDPGRKKVRLATRRRTQGKTTGKKAAQQLTLLQKCDVNRNIKL
jgi:hypothetical protein